VTIGIAASALAFVGSVLPWVTLDLDGESTNAKGWEGDGMFTLIAALVAAGLFVAAKVTKKSVAAAAAALPGLVILVFGILNVVSSERIIRTKLEDEAPGAPAEQIDALVKAGAEVASTGFGLWLVLIGGLGALACAAMAGLKARA
jgi:hypothetical protein